METKTILWSEKSINTVNNIMLYLNGTKMIRPLGYMVKKFLDKYSTSEFNITTVQDIMTVPRDSIFLAYACEVYLKHHIEGDIVLSNKIIYKVLGKIIYEVINGFFSYRDWDLGFEETYLINLLSELYSSSVTNETKKNNEDKKTDETKETVRSCYFFTKQLIFLLDQNPNLMYFMDGPIVKCQDLDLTLLTKQQNREILSILRTRRTIYLRLLLVIINEIIQENTTVNIIWIKQKTKIKSLHMLRDLLDNIIIQIIIIITGNNCF